jgi:two-component system, OmpR family, phosphate regulon response regulator PhoB
LLPDAPGLDVLREIRDADGATSRFDPSLPVMIVSGKAGEHDRVRGLREGADDYLVNPPFSPAGDESGSRLVAGLSRDW